MENINLNDKSIKHPLIITKIYHDNKDIYGFLLCREGGVLAYKSINEALQNFNEVFFD